MVPRPATPCTPRLRISASSARGTSATKHSPAISSGLVARIATIRHRTRSERTSSERRHGLPRGRHGARHGRDVRAQEAVGRPAVEPDEPAAGGSGAEQQRQPDPDDAQRGAERERQHRDRSQDRDRHVDDEVRRGVGGALQAAVELERARSRTALDRHVARAAQGLDRERRVGAASRPLTRGAPTRSRPRPGSGRAARTRAPSPASSAASAAVARTPRSRRCRRSPRAPAARSRRSPRRRCRRCAW